MEDHSAVDISIRNVAVRLNDSNIGTDLNGKCVNSLFAAPSAESETQVTRFNEECEEKCHTKHSDISDELQEKLQVCNDSSTCGYLNGCDKLLHEDIKRLDLSVNGINKCSNHELLNAHSNKLNHRTCDQTTSKFDVIKECNENHQTETQSFCDDSEFPSLYNSSSSPRQLYPKHSETSLELEHKGITYLGYESERQMPDIMRLIQKDLSEPYSIYTYRYFIHNWPKLCFLAQDGDSCVGAIVCKLDAHKKRIRRGYIAMLAVDEKYRKRRIGSNLVLKAINAMVNDNADEVVLETEITNKPALRLYENLGFVRDKRLFRYYLNGVDALRLKLWLR